MQVILMNDNFEAVTIFDISLLQTITATKNPAFKAIWFGSDWQDLSYFERTEGVRKEIRSLLRLSFSFGIIQDITVGMPKVMLDAIWNIWNSGKLRIVGDDSAEIESNVVEVKINELLKELKNELHAFISKAKKESVVCDINDFRIFFTEKRVREFILKAKEIEERILAMQAS